MSHQTADSRPVFCVVGAGNGGLAMAGHLGLQSFEVRLWNRSEARLEPISARGGIEVTGEVNGFGRIALATSDIRAAMAFGGPGRWRRWPGGSASTMPCSADGRPVRTPEDYQVLYDASRCGKYPLMRRAMRVPTI